MAFGPIAIALQLIVPTRRVALPDDQTTWTWPSGTSGQVPPSNVIES
jgi:hypothetical protein